MIPLFEPSGNLPPGIHWATWKEVVARFSTNTDRQKLVQGLKGALDVLRKAGCDTVYVDGSFVSNKYYLNDFDCCWDITNVSLDLIDPVLLDFTHKQTAQKAKYGGELFPNLPEQDSDLTMLDWFRQDKDTHAPKGIIAIDLRHLP